MIFAKTILATLLILSIPTSASAQGYSWWSVGPKIGYQFGSGLVGGFEVTYIPPQREAGRANAPLYGITMDVDFSPSGKRVHLGVEVVAVAGIDVGPTFFLATDGASVGFSAIAFLGFGAYGFYEFDIPVGGAAKSSQVLGAYLKGPLGNHPKVSFGG